MAKKTFESAAWKQSTEGDRYWFVNDLINRRLLDKLTKDQVIVLLGAPSSENEEGVAYVVKIGSRGFDQVYVLDIRIDQSSKKVMKYSIRGD